MAEGLEVLRHCSFVASSQKLLALRAATTEGATWSTVRPIARQRRGQGVIQCVDRLSDRERPSTSAAKERSPRPATTGPVERGVRDRSGAVAQGCPGVRPVAIFGEMLRRHPELGAGLTHAGAPHPRLASRARVRTQSRVALPPKQLRIRAVSATGRVAEAASY